MRKIYMFNFVTLDGYFEGPNHDINWHNTDEEFGEFVHEEQNMPTTIIFGKTTYELMAEYWSTEAAFKDDEITTKYMRDARKLVVSHSLKKVEWENSELVTIEELKKIKEGEGKDIAVFGSGNLSKTLIKEDLIDEFRIMINPLLLGKGTHLFQNDNLVKLKLVDSRIFKNGNVLLTYHKA